ncbi:MAG: hypothetical protein WA635_04145 [Gallionella sp.]
MHQVQQKQKPELAQSPEPVQQQAYLEQQELEGFLLPFDHRRQERELTGLQSKQNES